MPITGGSFGGGGGADGYVNVVSKMDTTGVNDGLKDIETAAKKSFETVGTGSEKAGTKINGLGMIFSAMTGGMSDTIANVMPIIMEILTGIGAAIAAMSPGVLLIGSAFIIVFFWVGVILGILTALLTLVAAITAVIVIWGVVLGTIAIEFSKWFISMINTMSGAMDKTSEYGKQVQHIKNLFDSVQQATFAAFSPIVSFALPYIEKIVHWLVTMLNLLGMIMARLLGQAKVWQYVEGSTKAAGAAAKGALAAFDKLNVLAQAGGGSGAGSFVSIDVDPDILAKTWAKLKKWWHDLLIDIFGSKDNDGLLQTFWDKTVAFWLGVWDWYIKNVQTLFLGDKDTSGMFGGLRNFALKVIEEIKLLWNTFLAWGNGFVAIVNTLLVGSKDVKGSGLWGGITEVLDTFLLGARALWTMFLDWIKIMVGDVRGAILGTKDNMGIWEGITTAAANVIEELQRLWNKFLGWCAVIVTDIRETFIGSKDKTGLWNSIKTAALTAFTDMESGIHTTVNNIIGFVNQMIAAIAGGINSLIASLNTFSVNIPGIAGRAGYTFGLHLNPVSGPVIPSLATGAVIPPGAAFAAILGDQKSGTNIETPENLLRQIVKEETSQLERKITINFTGSLAAFARELKPVIEQEVIRAGGSLVQGVIS